MKLNLNYCLMFVLVIVILYSCLGNMLREGLRNSSSGNSSSNNISYSPTNLDQQYHNNPSSYQPETLYNDSDNQTTNGIPRSEIPNGNQDLYILKSEIVPPVCPKCPPVLACNNDKKCQPCPPCARCPEPAFECKKVPNYQSSNSSYLPRPMLNDFSDFS